MINTIIQTFRSIFCKPSKERIEGTIKFFDRKKRFGFIVSTKQEYFFHATSAAPKDFKQLKDGAKVSFIVTQGKKGPQADQIKIIQSL